MGNKDIKQFIQEEVTKLQRKDVLMEQKHSIVKELRLLKENTTDEFTLESRDDLMEILNAEFNLDCRSSEAFYGKGGNLGIWITNAEDNEEQTVLDYYNDSFELGVKPEFSEWLDTNYGCYVEWNDPGTAFIWK